MFSLFKRLPYNYGVVTTQQPLAQTENKDSNISGSESESESKLAKILSPVGKFNNGVLTCPVYTGNELTVTGIDDCGTLVFTNRYYRTSGVNNDNVTMSLNFDLSKLDLASVKDVKIQNLPLNG
jgi:hypothetical protein